MSDWSGSGPKAPWVEPGGFVHWDRDMTACFAADLTLDDCGRLLAPAGQWLPLDGPAGVPLRRLIGLDSTGPLRFGYGGWRDVILGVQYDGGDGARITVGGRAVKNVAGYDLCKLQVGSAGALGRLSAVICRTWLAPTAAVRVALAPRPALARELVATPLRPQWALLTPEELILGYLGDEHAIDWYEAQAPTLSPREVRRRSPSQDADERRSLWPVGSMGSFLRATVAPSRLEGVCGRLAGLRWAADPIFGILAVVDPPGHLVGDILSADGRGMLVEADRVGVFGLDASEVGMIRRLKDQLDPNHRLPALPEILA